MQVDIRVSKVSLERKPIRQAAQSSAQQRAEKDLWENAPATREQNFQKVGGIVPGLVQ